MEMTKAFELENMFTYHGLPNLYLVWHNPFMPKYAEEYMVPGPFTLIHIRPITCLP